MQSYKAGLNYRSLKIEIQFVIYYLLNAIF